MANDVDLAPLLERAAAGDAAARQELLTHFEDRLKRMVRVRMDQRLAARVDPSDVVQEAYIEAWQKLSEYLATRPVEFYPWIRKIAWERLIDLHRVHLDAKKRSVKHEYRDDLPLPDRSSARLVSRLAATGPTASIQLLRKEATQRLAEGLRQLSPADREVLVLRHLEQLPVRDIAGIIGATESAVKVRCFRAVRRLYALLADDAPNDRSDADS